MTTEGCEKYIFEREMKDRFFLFVVERIVVNRKIRGKLLFD